MRRNVKTLLKPHQLKVKKDISQQVMKHSKESARTLSQSFEDQIDFCSIDQKLDVSLSKSFQFGFTYDLKLQQNLQDESPKLSEEQMTAFKEDAEVYFDLFDQMTK